jgi:threonine/homoserine/homoserine lactone efflux protein
MISDSTLLIFIPTFLLVSFSPGFCMTLALTLGISQGLKRTFWMMWGELLGVGIVATLAVLGVAHLVLQYPIFMQVVKWVGGAYIGWIGWQLFQSKGQLAIAEHALTSEPASRWLLWRQGFITAVSNPKGWAFHMALLPNFISAQAPFWPQLLLLLLIILFIEFLSLLVYASGGQALRQLLLKPERVSLMNRVTGSLMLAVAIWMIVG